MRRRLTVILVFGYGATISGAAVGAEPGRGFPYRGASVQCVPVDIMPRTVAGDHRWFAKTLAHYQDREDGCRVDGVTRYGQAQAWNVRLVCRDGGAREDWVLNYDGSITADRGGTKTTYRACPPGSRR